MSVLTLEGIIEHGQIRLKTHVSLPDNTKVYVVVPGIAVEQGAHIFSPPLARPEGAADFKMEVVEEDSHASV